MTSESGSNPSSKADAASQESERGSFAGVKDQFDDITRSSVTDFKENFASVAGDAVNGVKETVAEGIPVATEALQSAQDRVRSLVKGAEETVEPEESGVRDARMKDAERIDQMDSEQLCDFLREKHRSTNLPSTTK